MKVGSDVVCDSIEDIMEALERTCSLHDEFRGHCNAIVARKVRRRGGGERVRREKFVIKSPSAISEVNAPFRTLFRCSKYQVIQQPRATPALASDS